MKRYNVTNNTGDTVVVNLLSKEIRFISVIEGEFFCTYHMVAGGLSAADRADLKSIVG